MTKGERATTRKKAPRRRSADAEKKRVPKVVPPADVGVLKLGAKADAPQPRGAKAANTIIYVHGIGNKPAASILKCQWDTALFGGALGDRSRMVYWVNRDYYPRPLDETCASGDSVQIEDDEASTRAIMAVARGESGTEELALEKEIQALTQDENTRAWLACVADKLEAGTRVSAAEFRAAEVRAKVLPLPEFLRRLITRKITRAFLRDVNDFLFKADRRDAMERALLERLSGGGGPFVMIAHSQGSMIAYDVLRRLDPTQIEVPLLVTIGSPLGLQEVQDALRQWTGGGLPFPPCVGRWINVADRLDPVAFDADISNDFEGKIENEHGIGLNPDAPQHPHSATGYLRTKHVRHAVRDTVGPAFGQAIAPFILAKDLVRDLEDGQVDQRHATLIQLVVEDNGRAFQPRMIEDLASSVERKIATMVKAGGGEPADAEVERLRHFVAAKLTRTEAETLRSLYREMRIDSIWRNAAKRALLHRSTHTVQARPANLGYGADGHGITWAVLDTGIRADHPHFNKEENVGAIQNVAMQWDCTAHGTPRELAPGDKDFDTLDNNGHGTHVAGIIAGECRVEMRDGTVETLAGMAPRCQLYGFKVLDDDGNGNDSAIIKALDLIAEMNESAGQTVVHGINLSLGGGFDPSVFGCGHTPLCQELRRLWRQGVLVVLAAGNEGYAVLTADHGQIQANLDLTIGDPANLDEAIAVGSVHKGNPHTYGVSYFSSRGPTADGRRKPDVVAPGERILSARHDWGNGRNSDDPLIDDLYVEMSGTSMAAPHVSGILAAFLSLRREFIGYPDRVKEILLGGCVDLRRDPDMQGAGLPNLIKMLALG